MGLQIPQKTRRLHAVKTGTVCHWTGAAQQTPIYPSHLARPREAEQSRLATKVTELKPNKSVLDMTPEELAAATKPSGTLASRKGNRYARAFLKKQRAVNQRLPLKNKAAYYRDRIKEGLDLDQVWERLVFGEARLLFLHDDLEQWVADYKEV